MKFLFFGDIVAKAGRKAIAQVLPTWQDEYKPDLIIGNVDNVAHGKGVTASTLNELLSLGFTAFTSGDHIFDKPEAESLLKDSHYNLIRPANFPASVVGSGSKRLQIGSREVLLISLMGQVFLSEQYESPFRVVDEIIAKEKAVGDLAGIIIDFHAEATSEKVALGWHLAGKVTAILGTHTHIPTCDEWILPGGTAYVTDAGMVGIKESVIGVKIEQSLGRFLTQMPIHFDPVETGTVDVTALLVEFDSNTAKAQTITRLTKKVTIS